jgi:hypothetical protein
LTAARNLLDSRSGSPFLLVDDAALEDFSGVKTDRPDCVVVGLAPEKFDYPNVNQAFR